MPYLLPFGLNISEQNNTFKLQYAFAYDFVQFVENTLFHGDTSWVFLVLIQPNPNRMGWLVFYGKFSSSSGRIWILIILMGFG